MKNLPRESAMFTQIDNKWKIIMKQAKDSMNIKRYGEEYNSTYTLKTLRNNNETFDIVHCSKKNANAVKILKKNVTLILQ